VAIIVTAIYVAKQREVVLGDDSGDPAPPAPSSEPGTPHDEVAPTQQFETQA
jgi:hypothetical protein